jgi:hypothetical protein
MWSALTCQRFDMRRLVAARLAYDGFQVAVTSHGL